MGSEAFRNGSSSCIHRTWLAVPPTDTENTGFAFFETNYRALSWFGRECGTQVDRLYLDRIDVDGDGDADVVGFENDVRVDAGAGVRKLRQELCAGGALVPITDEQRKVALSTLRASTLRFAGVTPRDGIGGYGRDNYEMHDEEIIGSAQLAKIDAVPEQIAMKNAKTSSKKKQATRKRKVHVLLYDRTDTRRRQWVNSEEVAARLRADKRVRLTFVQKHPGELLDQVKLYHSADILVAPHGAAMANSFFMPRGSGVVIVWRFCKVDVRDSTLLAKEWTGWHAWLMGLNLAYVQCHEEGRIRGEKGWPDFVSGVYSNMTDGKNVARVEDVMEVLGPEIERQHVRLMMVNESSVKMGGSDMATVDWLFIELTFAGSLCIAFVVRRRQLKRVVAE